MLKPFFTTAMLAPGRQATFRRVTVLHVILLAALGSAAAANPTPGTLTAVAYLILILGIVEGASLIGWRLTQLPKSQALEFLLVSPVQPRRVFFAEFLVGATRFALISLAGVPVLMGLLIAGAIALPDLWPLALMPFTWGVVAALSLTVWAYEPLSVRKVGEVIAIGGVLVYLVVGILAAENLRLWLDHLPPAWADLGMNAMLFLHESNPFGVIRNWFAHGRVTQEVWTSFLEVNLAGVVLVTLLGVRAACRLKGHFHDRHYRPISSERAAQTEKIGDRPLSWWAVRRVMEYSGRVNVWLAGGFSVLYAAFIVAGDDWPSWMGRLVFQIFETWGGVPVVATAMAVMAAVPAVFQFGLWDPSVQDRCRRLELLLLTELHGQDYWHASLSAAWRRGRGYLFIALMLWAALAISGRVSPTQAVAAAVGGGVLWAFSFAVGFRAFSTGFQASGIATLLSLGFPFLLVLLLRSQMTTLATFIPTAVCYIPLSVGLTPAWAISTTSLAALTVWLTLRGWARSDAELRRWYDANQGRKSME